MFFAHRLSKPFLCSCFAMAYLSSPSPCLWHSFKGIPVGRAVGDNLNDTCIPLLTILCWLILQEWPSGRLSNVCAQHSSLSTYSSSSFPLNHSVQAEARALLLVLLN